MDMRTLLESYEEMHALATDLAETAEKHVKTTVDRHLLLLLHSHARKRIEHMRQDASLLAAAVKP